MPYHSSFPHPWRTGTCKEPFDWSWLWFRPSPTHRRYSSLFFSPARAYSTGNLPIIPHFFNRVYRPNSPLDPRPGVNYSEKKRFWIFKIKKKKKKSFWQKSGVTRHVQVFHIYPSLPRTAWRSAPVQYTVLPITSIQVNYRPWKTMIQLLCNCT